MPPEGLRAARANRVLPTDEKRVRRQNTVFVNTKQVVWVSYKIADLCADVLFIRTQVGDPRGRAAVRARDNKAVRTDSLQTFKKCSR
jgi:hypothetical protein